ncbi:AP endonuclease [Suhomyces tanzawaensis NRRL Y-17324]|uniref:AP endonuclease n=1 Tax=Suhomyces tanzawaensis NRRL Y-17324 TaxID=984487 RepID=A0A1E4SPB2_9ASCO|nr:AP endonuclease [Suhomyces tanzawaensis NRRL Y-17324]ODV81361.1 AP endonuclease [Suhomyces tanzawaensis NRRL Y-17324]
MPDILDAIVPTLPGSVRYVSFNVNGAKTLFNYHPWTQMNNDFNALFRAMHADIITLQELKVTASGLLALANIGHLANYRLFISLPKTKKGYSGVGLFVRVPTASDPPGVQRGLTVLRAEEGVTGHLPRPSAQGASLSSSSSYRDSPDAIGGYPDIDSTTGLHLDSEGRCVVVELAGNVVVFAVYCPANSMGTDEGESFRLDFLRALLARAHNLKHALGKEVVVMGDINVCLDLIDTAEGMRDRISQLVVVPGDAGTSFEAVNYEECVRFKTSTPARELLNQYTVPGLKCDLALEKSLLNKKSQFLYDTTRYMQGREMKLYTVWNTLTNARPSNFGSRIDLILCSCPHMLAHVTAAHIWPGLLGSDHCPVYTDFHHPDPPQEETTLLLVPQKLPFEAKHFYKLSKTRDISQLFLKRSSSPPESETVKKSRPATPKDKNTTTKSNSKGSLVYVSRKPARQEGQKSISTFFTKSTRNDQP